MPEDNQFKVTGPAEVETQVKNAIHEPGFQTPEEVAAREDSSASPIIGHFGEAKVKAEKAMKKKRRINFKWPPTKKQLFIGLAVLIVLLVGGYFSYRTFFKHNNKSISLNINVKPVVPAPTTVASDLSGLQVNPSLNKLPVTAVMVENSLDARPQSGLSVAGVVFEAVAEGGVTRFMALYQDTSPSNVGPIRSARPYYAAWALGFDAGYAHVGGSPDALSDIQSWNIRDLDEFYNGSSYHRISTREAPHNVYTSIADLNQLEDSKGYTSSQFSSWPRTPAKPAKVPTVTTINLALSGPDYDPTYTYDSSTNSYNRAEDGSPQIDANNNAQISPKVVVAIVVPETQGALDASGAYYSDYSYVGSGTAYIFQDGNMTTGQWTKSSNSAQITFTDADSKPIALIPGQVWITAVSTASAVTYSK